ncbi:MAG: SRPBCC domain-containing protein [Planctomycetes bacterium]|nr:SRPBCC domain-containing protein [Planctomycetota bacterium]
MAAECRPFIITRTFDAPRELVWKAWTERDRLMEWFGPKGFTMSVGELDFRPGGTFHYCLKSAEGHAMWGKWVYREIVPPERIVLVSSFSDEQGGKTRHPMAADWPLETLSTTTFSEQNGKTTITIEWSPLNATDAERRMFDSAHAGMNQGWGGTFEQLEAYLGKT